MKLKRCPNLHYYDGDKYPTCPHCNIEQPHAFPTPPQNFGTPPTRDEIEPPFGSGNNPPWATPVQTNPFPQPAPNNPERFPKNPFPEHGQDRTEHAPVEPPEPVPDISERISRKPAPEPVPDIPERFPAEPPEPVPDISERIPRNPAPEPVPDISERFPAEPPEPVPDIPERFPAEPPEPVPDIPEHFPEKHTPELQGIEEPVIPSVIQQHEPKLEPVEEPPKKSITNEIGSIGFTGDLDTAKSTLNRLNGLRHDSSKTVIQFDDFEEGLVFGWLTIINTSAKGKFFPLTEIKSTIGRSGIEHTVDVDLRHDRNVSRGAQAIMVYDTMNCKFFLQNANAKTLVYLNGQLVLTYAEVKAYDKIRLGKTEMIFVPLCTDKFSWELEDVEV